MKLNFAETLVYITRDVNQRQWIVESRAHIGSGVHVLVTEAELVGPCDRGSKLYIGKHMTCNQLYNCDKSQRGSVLKMGQYRIKGE